MYYGSCPCILFLSLSFSLIHRAHFLNLSAEIIRTCCVLLFKSPGIDQIPAELRQRVEQFVMRSMKLLFLFGIRRNCLRSGRVDQWPIYKKGNKTDCSNYRGISLLPTTYKILSNILLSKLTPYEEKIIGDHQCGFWHNRSTRDHIFSIHQILEKKCEYNEYRLQESLWFN